VAFELDRFEVTADGRLEVAGRWFGVRGLRFVRPSLMLQTDGGERSLLALLDHKPWAPEEGSVWIAAFPWDGGDFDPSQAELAVAPSVVVPLSTGSDVPTDNTRRRPSLREQLRAEERRASRLEAEVAWLRAERGDLGARADRAREERDRAIEARDAAQRDREKAVGARDAAESERDEAMRERDSVRADARRATADRDRAVREGEVALHERDQAARERDSAFRGRSAALSERDAARTRHEQFAAATVADLVPRARSPLEALGPPVRARRARGRGGAGWLARAGVLAILVGVALILLVLVRLL
jgi:hypothetical protein